MSYEDKGEERDKMTNLPKAVPIDQMQIFRLQGRLQLQPNTVKATESSSSGDLAEALNQIKLTLKESGYTSVLVTNKSKNTDGSYFELLILESELKLVLITPSSKFEMAYSFLSQTLSMGSGAIGSPLDLEKFATKIRQIAANISDDKVDVIGRES